MANYMSVEKQKRVKSINQRFDGFLPIVVDVETGGANPQTDALLEIAAFPTTIDASGLLQYGELFHCHVLPFEGSKLHPEAMQVNQIDPYHPFRFAVAEKPGLSALFVFVSEQLQLARCRRAVLVGHNAHFDLSFIKAAAKRCHLSNNPFHAYTVLDTATLGGLMFGKTVLAKALRAARIPFDREQAHSAIYDAEQTAKLFCQIVNSINR